MRQHLNVFLDEAPIGEDISLLQVFLFNIQESLCVEVIVTKRVSLFFHGFLKSSEGSFALDSEHISSKSCLHFSCHLVALCFLTRLSFYAPYSLRIFSAS